jgi:formyl-CoA transferase
MRAGVAIVDLFTGLYASNAILAALHQRNITGGGTAIDLSLFETQLAMLANQASNALVSGQDPVRQGNTHPNIVPYQPFDAADQPIVIAVGNDRQFARLAEICGAPEWVADTRFATNGARVAHRADLVPLIAEHIALGSAAEWLAKLEAAGIPAGPINRINQALADPQAEFRHVVRELGTGKLGQVPTVGSPLRFDGERADADLPPPALGEHTEEVLSSIGIDSDQIEQLRTAGVIG